MFPERFFIFRSYCLPQLQHQGWLGLLQRGMKFILQIAALLLALPETGSSFCNALRHPMNQCVNIFSEHPGIS